MPRPRDVDLPRLALALGLALAAAIGLWLATRPHHGVSSAPATTTRPAPAPTTTTAPPPPPPTTTAPLPTTTAPAPPPAPVTFSWQDAGGLVLHPESIDPGLLGREMRAAGFGWVALFLGDGPSLTAPDASWIARFRAAGGLAVGGWSVLRDDPVGEAQGAAELVASSGLSFYIADAEAEYAYTNGEEQSSQRYARSQQFVSAFRALEPSLPVGVSSYCRPDRHDLDWAAWAKADFVFLPQAYENDFGAAASPATCAAAAARFFPRTDVHPTVGSYPGVLGPVAPAQAAADLHAAGTSGFSIFPAEVGLDQQDWQAYGTAIATLGIATQPAT